MPLLEIINLKLWYRKLYNNKYINIHAINNISISVERGDSLAITGRSGSGKSSLGFSVAGLLPESTGYLDGVIKLDGRIILKGPGRIDDENKGKVLKEIDKRNEGIRGKRVFLVYQGAINGFNPFKSIGEQVIETIQEHYPVSRDGAYMKVIDLFNDVNIESYLIDRYPHEYSSDMKLRAMIAMAISCNPDILILDEPLSGINPTFHYYITRMLLDIKRKYNLTMILLSENLSLIQALTDKIAVLNSGKIVEYGKLERIVKKPSHPYTDILINSNPSASDIKRPLQGIPEYMIDEVSFKSGCPFHKFCPYSEARCIKEEPGLKEVDPEESVACHHPLIQNQTDGMPLQTRETDRQLNKKNDESTRNENKSSLYVIQDLVKYHSLDMGFLKRIRRIKKNISVINGISFEIKKGEIFGIVGESYSNINRIGKLLLDMDHLSKGTVVYNGKNLSKIDKNKNNLQEFKRETAILYPDPVSSLSPMHTVFSLISEPLLINKRFYKDEDINKRVMEAMKKAGFKNVVEYTDRYPVELTTYENQLVAIARSVILEPQFIVADDPASMMDSTSKIDILNKILELRKRYNITFLYLGEDILYTSYVSDKVAIFYLDRFVEIADATRITVNALHPYTRLLLSSKKLHQQLPLLNNEFKWEVPNSLIISSGCRFHSRCLYAIDKCSYVEPALKEVEPYHMVACHLDLRDK